MKHIDLISFLMAGGVNVKELDRGPKDSHQLLQEVEKKEVKLVHSEGKVWRVAETVKIVVRIGDEHHPEFIKQTARIYPDGKHVQMKGFATITETRIREEELSETVIRGMREECGLVIAPEQIAMPNALDCLKMEHLGIPEYGQKIDAHPSSVYSGIWSVANVSLFEVRLAKRPWPENLRVIDDGGVLITLLYWKPSADMPEHLEQRLRALSP